jgi:hypothetical protein
MVYLPGRAPRARPRAGGAELPMATSGLLLSAIAVQSMAGAIQAFAGQGCWWVRTHCGGSEHR